jgi:hypothetical protein
LLALNKWRRARQLHRAWASAVRQAKARRLPGLELEDEEKGGRGIPRRPFAHHTGAEHVGVGPPHREDPTANADRNG